MSTVRIFVFRLDTIARFDSIIFGSVIFTRYPEGECKALGMVSLTYQGVAPAARSAATLVTLLIYKRTVLHNVT